MDNDLNLLISLCEEEKDKLEKNVLEFIAESEYLMAHYQFQGVRETNRKLQALRYMQDNRYQAKESTMQSIRWAETQLVEATSEHAKDMWREYLEQYRDRLAHLNETVTPPKPPEHFTLFDDALRRFFDKQIKNLKLVLKKSDNLLLEFSWSKKVLRLTMPGIKQQIKAFNLGDEKIHHLKNLGFAFNKTETRLSLSFTGARDDIMVRLKIILCKIIFEVFYFQEFENESYIQFTEKPVIS